jgi:hypothetical protein
VSTERVRHGPPASAGRGDGRGWKPEECVMLREIAKAGSGLAVVALVCTPLLLVGCDEQKNSTETKKTTVTPNEKVTETQKDEVKVNPK